MSLKFSLTDGDIAHRNIADNVFLHKNNGLKWTTKNILLALKKVFLEDWPNEPGEPQCQGTAHYYVITTILCTHYRPGQLTLQMM